MSQIRQRIKQLLDERNTTVNRIAAGDGAIQRRLHRQLNEDVTMSVDTVLLIMKAFPGLSAQWLLTGEGSPFGDAASAESERQPLLTLGQLRAAATGESADDETVIPVYSVEASANLNTLDVGGYEPEIVGRVVVPNMPKCDGATYVRGDSMYPLLQSGDLIGFRMMPVVRESLFFGEIYLVTLDVEGDRYLTVKYVYRSDRGDDYIKLVSANPSHEPKDVHLSAVRGIALVKFTVRMNSML